MAELTIATPAGDAGVTLEQATGARRLLVVGHGAGGSVHTPDLVAIRNACLAAGISVARVTQPYRLAGLDFVYAGRSSGARVACRTAADPAVTPRPIAVVAVAFPVHPPGRPEKSRLSELAGVPQPVLVVQGRSDPFGMPEPAPGRTVRQVAGDHSLKGSAAEAGRLVAEWLAELAG